MTHSARLKIEIIQRLEVFSMGKLERVLDFVKRLDVDESRRKRIMAFAGSWKDLDQEVFDDLTIHLLERRAEDTRSF